MTEENHDNHDDHIDRAQAHLASLKRDMRKTLEDAVVRAAHKVMAEFEAKSDDRLMEDWGPGPHEVHSLPAREPEQPAQQEPVAYMSQNNDFYIPDDIVCVSKSKILTPLYTRPQAREPLTDDEIWKFWWSRPEVPEGEDDSMEAEFVAAVRRVLAAHGIGEKK